jgi:4-amino-4-deoxy-L-arabinose transferase-like glycosyltransferase
MRNYKQILLIIIIAVSVFLRIYRLSSIPEGFHADEAAFGYNAYSILKTGKDEYGKSFPLILRSFDDYKGSIYAYLTIPFIALNGLNEWSVRIVSVIVGLLFIWVIYKLVYEIMENRQIAYISALIFSLSPISIFLSRVQSDPLVANLFLHTGLLFYLRYIKTKRIGLLILGAIVFCLAIFTHQAVATLQIIMLSIIFIWKFRKMNSSVKITSFFMFFAIVLLSIISFTSSVGRYNELSFMKNPIATIPLNAGIFEDGILRVPVYITRIFHNKIIQSFRFLTETFGKYWSIQFLFLEARQPIREFVYGFGFFHLVEFPLLIYGIYVGFRRHRSVSLALTIWMILGSIALSMAVDETPNNHRFYYISLPLYIFIALAIQKVMSIKFKVFSYSLKGINILIICYSLSMVTYVHGLFFHQPTHQPYFRGYAYKELVSELQSLKANYTNIIFTTSQSSPYIYYLFFSRYDPQKYQDIGSPRDFEGSKIDNIIFSTEDCPFTAAKYEKYRILEEKTLFINRGDCVLNRNANIVRTIRWRDNIPAFQLVTYISTPSAQIEL